MQSWPNKDPDEVVANYIDWSKTIGEETIAASTWVVPAGITAGSTAFSSNSTVITLSGGVAGTLYQFVNRIVTNGGHTYEWAAQLLVVPSSYGIVDLHQTKAMLRIDHDDDDMILSMLIASASQSIATYLRDPTILRVDSPPAYIDPRIKTATVMLVGMLYKSPDGDPDKMFPDRGFLPKPVTALLFNMRSPALA